MENDSISFKEIYQKHARLVRAVIFELTGPDYLDDLVQETFIKIWKSLSSYKGDCKLSTWVYRIAVNTATDHLRRRKRVFSFWKERNDTTSTGETLALISHGSLASTIETQQLVSSALLQLDEKYRTVVVLFFLHDLTIEDIAEVLDIPGGTVKSRLHEAKLQLQKYFEKNGVRNEKKRL